MPVQLMNSTLIPLCTHLGERLGVPIGDAFLPAAGRRSSGKRAKFLAYLACWDDSAPYVARGLLQILQPKDSQFLDADGRKLFTDRLLKGKSDPTACPEVRGFTFGRPFQADAHVCLIDLVGDSCRARLRTNPRSRDGGQPAPQLKGRYSTASIAFLASLTRCCPPRFYHRGGDGCGDDRADARNARQALADGVALVPGHEPLTEEQR